MTATLHDAVAAFAALPVTRHVAAALRPGTQRAAGGLWGGSAALLLGVLAQEWTGPILVITADDDGANDLADDLRSLTPLSPLHLVAQDHDVDDRLEATTLGRRLEVLQAVAGGGRFVVVCGLGALLDPVPRPSALRGRRLTLRRGDRLDPGALVRQAVDAGLRKVPVVLGPGEVSQRGDVVDLYPLGSPIAVRVEFFDEDIESLRRFEPATQRSLAVVDEATVPLGGEGDFSGHVIEHLGHPDLLVIRHEPLRLDERQQQLALHRADGSARLQLLGDTTARLTRLDVSSLPSHDLDFKVLSAGSAVGSGEADPVGRLRSIRGVKRDAITILCRTAEERQRLGEIFAKKQVSADAENVHLRVGGLSRGFRVPELGLTVISNVEFAGVPQSTRVRERPVLPTRALQSFFELGPGDLVVHAAHGIAVFEGMELIERGEAKEDHLRLCFRDDVRLLVPASKIDLVQKYVGAGGDAKPKLDKLGGKGFQRRVAEVSEALLDLAADLLDVQSQRALLTREPYARDPLEGEFLDAFPFTDTPDQQRAWAEIRQDLEGTAVSDRLLCGDVGFGKTELAMRAAFKVALHGKQVAVLVPTTVLAEQHARTFGERFEPFGLVVEALSRYVRGKDRNDILRRLAQGKVDVLVGTHRMLGDDVGFKNLGLLVVDEEQRFGVRHKEQLKKLRLAVDVLTLSATPIPRTLHAAMLGVRGISTLATPPPGRQEVETKVAYWEPHLVADALEQELSRQGQVFVVHNRVESLERVARAVHELAPSARIEIGHGQMTATQIERAIRRFVGGEADVLVSTSIIENGLDIPRANTILVDRADLFGLADLHQLRGRVGRSERKAHCYFLLDRTRPPRDEARKRLKAVEELGHLGAGFAVAMKDLEIRGAGNLLGPQQSGHIASVGYEMYVDLLRSAIAAAKRREKAEPHVREVDVDLRLQAYLPQALASDPKQRLELLREMARAIDVESTAALAATLTDRFGALPPPVQNLLLLFLLEHALLDHGVLGVQFPGEDRVVVRHPPGQPLGGAWLDHFASVRQVEAGKTHLLLPRRRRPWTAQPVLELLLESLLGPSALPRIRSAWQTTRRHR